MTGRGHTLSGLVCIFGAYTFFKYQVELNTIGIILGIIGVIFGATAPDWLEIRRPDGGTVIPHRTITHVVILWVGLFLFSLVNISNQQFLNYEFLSFLKIASYIPQSLENISYSIFAFFFGFSAGGLLHLLVDFPNPMGIPFFIHNRRFSLKLWKSGKNEPFIIFLLLQLNLIYADVLSINYDVIINFIKSFK